MKIFIGEIPKNPNRKYDITDGCQELSEEWYQFNEGQLSILNQCVEVNTEKFIDTMLGYSRDEMHAIMGRFVLFLESEIKKQEGKDGK
jgi:hypothetical protein